MNSLHPENSRETYKQPTRTEVLFLAKNPPSLDGPALGARLSNNKMWEMIQEQATNVDIVPIGQKSDEIDTAELYETLEATNPETILVETPDTADLKILQEGIPADMHNRVAALWRYTVLPRQPLPGQTEAQWQELLEARGEYSRTIGKHICLSPHQREELISIGVDEDKIDIIPNQVGWENSPSKRRSLEAEQMRERFLDGDELGVLVISRVNTEKGLDWLPGFVKGLRSERSHLHPDAPFKKVRVSLAGPVDHEDFWNDLQDQIKKVEEETEGRLSDSVTFEHVGEVKGDNMDAMLNAYDVLLMPSPEEGFGRATVEAMASGMTVIGNGECPATANLVTQAPYTIGQTAPNPAKAAEQVVRFMNNQELLEDVQENAAMWANNHYTRERAMEGLRRALELGKAS